jgi:transcriptional regulator with XRE-family HTH domain
MDRERTKVLKKMVGANLRLARLRQSLTQEQAADLMGISSEVYGRMERGGIFPRVNRLIVFCQRLGVSADEILGLATAEQPIAPLPPPRKSEWLRVTERLMSLGPKLTQAQRQAARRHISNFYRVLLTFVEPEAPPTEKPAENKRPPSRES